MGKGRPTKYGKDILEKTLDYIDHYDSKYDDLIPSIAGLSVVLGIARETVRAWGHEENKCDFSAMLDKLLSKQEKLLINGGLGGVMNATITKLVLAKHGYSDKQEVDHTTGGEKITAIERTIVDS